MASWFAGERTIGTGESWWDTSVSAWGEDAMRGHDVAVTRGGVVTNGDQAAKAKEKQQNQKKKQSNKSKSKAENAYDEYNAIIQSLIFLLLLNPNV